MTKSDTSEEPVHERVVLTIRHVPASAEEGPGWAWALVRNKEMLAQGKETLYRYALLAGHRAARAMGREEYRLFMADGSSIVTEPTEAPPEGE